MGLRVLITNNTLSTRAGSELYVRDLALALLARGHTPIAYSTLLGDVAQELRSATIPVVDDLRSIAQPPDIIHGQHHLDTMTALLQFPTTPCVYFCHGWLPWEEAPPRFPRIHHYVAVDYVCRDRLLYEHAIPADRIDVLFNFVDLRRFRPRPQPLPPTPQRALVFSNAASAHTHLPAIQAACERLGIALDVVGRDSGHICTHPETILGEYDLVFAKARAALEAMAVGAAVVLCDAVGTGPMVTTANFEWLRPLNFGIRTLSNSLSIEGLVQAISQYNAEDAAAVSSRVRQTAGHDAVVEQILQLYERVVQQQHLAAPPDLSAEHQATAEYLRWLVPQLKELYTCKYDVVQTQTRLQHLEHERALSQETLAQSQHVLTQSQHALAHTQQVLQHTQSELSAVQQELAQLQRQHCSLQDGLQAERRQLHRLQNLLTHTQHMLVGVRQQADQSHQLYHQLQIQLAQLHRYITWAQSSKFWKLRAAWIRVKRSMGFAVTEMPFPSFPSSPLP